MTSKLVKIIILSILTKFISNHLKKSVSVPKFAASTGMSYLIDVRPKSGVKELNQEFIMRMIVITLICTKRNVDIYILFCLPAFSILTLLNGYYGISKNKLCTKMKTKLKLRQYQIGVDTCWSKLFTISFFATATFLS